MDINEQTVGLSLCKVVRGELRICEPVGFDRGREGVLVTLRRAQLAGRVGTYRDGDDYWADQLDENGDLVGEVGLDRESWNVLKNHLMRCKVEDTP